MQSMAMNGGKKMKKENRYFLERERIQRSQYSCEEAAEDIAVRRYDKAIKN